MSFVAKGVMALETSFGDREKGAKYKNFATKQIELGVHLVGGK